MFHRQLALAATVAAVSLGSLPGAGAQEARTASAIGNARFQRDLPGAYMRDSAPVIADLTGDGSNDIVVGGLDGRVYAFDANGNNLPGWPVLATAPVASSPAVGDVDGDGRVEVVVGTGSESIAGANKQGSINVFNGDGSRQCVLPDINDHDTSGVYNSPAIGDVNGDGTNDIVYGSWDNRIKVVSGGCTLLAFYDNADSVWSAPALRDTDGNGTQEIFIGGDASRGPAGQSHNGGTYRALRFAPGATSPVQSNLVQMWSREDSLEAFQSASAIGNIDGDPGLEVVTGSGAFWCRWHNQCRDSNKVWAFNVEDGSNVAGWPKSTDYNTTFNSAPALGDVDGDGRTDVVVGSNHYNGAGGLGGGAIEVFYGDGGPKERFARDLEILASPVIADVDGGNNAEIVIGTERQLFVLDPDGGDAGSDLDIVQSGLATRTDHKSTAAVGELGRGRWALVTAGFDVERANAGRVFAYDIPAPSALPWPMHMKNARRLGGELTDAAPLPPCTVGYWMVARDGGMFAFGTAGFFGSMGGKPLNSPIVGMANHPSGRGYWLVAADGGIFNYGAAGYFGSMGGKPLNSPIVGMAAHPSGNGYWLVAADGGMFNFGAAGFFGSKGGSPLNAPIVSMTAHPGGNGYWLVATDGGIFNYGAAGFHGSKGGQPLNKPIVGIARHSSGTGYWLVASDGGIFNYGAAGFHGSMGGKPLNLPIVGMTPTPSGNGYWFVASDGGIFAFGDTQFCGSQGGKPLNSPIAGMATS